MEALSNARECSKTRECRAFSSSVRWVWDDEGVILALTTPKLHPIQKTSPESLNIQHAVPDTIPSIVSNASVETRLALQEDLLFCARCPSFIAQCSAGNHLSFEVSSRNPICSCVYWAFQWHGQRGEVLSFQSDGVWASCKTSLFKFSIDSGVVDRNKSICLEEVSISSRKYENFQNVTRRMTIVIIKNSRSARQVFLGFTTSPMSRQSARFGKMCSQRSLHFAIYPLERASWDRVVIGKLVWCHDWCVRIPWQWLAVERKARPISHFTSILNLGKNECKKSKSIKYIYMYPGYCWIHKFMLYPLYEFRDLQRNPILLKFR